MAGDPFYRFSHAVRVAGSAFGDQRRGPRLALLSAIGAAHLLVIWLMLQPSTAGTIATPQPVLALFDVAMPTPLLETPPPPPMPPPPQAAKRAGGGGGSPGFKREQPTAMIDQPAAPAWEAVDATPAPSLPLPPPELAAGTAPVDLGRGGANGIGTGTGSEYGTGNGSGRGVGGGDGSGDVYVRADWIEKPGPDVWRQNWPHGHERLAQSVTVRLSCKVRRNGRPYSCQIRSEQPPRMGFSATAIAVLRNARVRPVARNGEAQWNTPILITLVFDALETAPRVPVATALP